MFRKKNSRAEVSAGIKTLFPRIWRYCLVLTGNKDLADDLAQMACVRALEKAHQYQAGTKLDRWIFTLTHRLWIDELCKKSVRLGGGMAPIEEYDLPDTKPNPEAHLILREVLFKTMTLPEAQRITLMLVYIEGYSYKETADILDIPIGTVMSRLAAARAKLAVALSQKSKTG